MLENTSIKNPTLVGIFLPKIENRTIASARDIALVLSFALLTAVFAKAKVGFGLVPITMQTFVVLLSGALLGSKRGAISQVFYLFGGLAGIPWFAGGGGILYIFSPSFGYIIGFIFAAFFVGWLCERKWDRNLKTAILAMLIGNMILYVFGLSWLARFIPLEKVLTVGLYPFIIGDLFKVLLAGTLLPIGWKIIKIKS